MATTDSASDGSMGQRRIRFRCGSCGNLTRFDVYETRRTRSYYHFTLGGDLSIEEEEILEADRERVTCRWCGSSDSIQQLTVEEGAPPAEGSRSEP